MVPRALLNVARLLRRCNLDAFIRYAQPRLEIVTMGMIRLWAGELPGRRLSGNRTRLIGGPKAEWQEGQGMTELWVKGLDYCILQNQGLTELWVGKLGCLGETG